MTKQEVIDLIKEKINKIKTEVDYDIYQYSDYDYQLTGQIDAYEDALELIESLTLSIEETEYVKTENSNDIFVTITCNKCHFHMLTSKDKDLSDLNYCPYCGRKIVR